MKEIYKGIPVSKGIVIGTVYKHIDEVIAVKTYKIALDEIDDEITRLEKSREKAFRFLEKLKEKADQDMGKEGSMIFEATITMLNDPVLIEDIKRIISDELINAEGAVKRAIDDMVEKFEAVDDEYIRQRIPDVQDVGKHLLGALQGELKLIGDIPEDAVIVADDLAPSETALLDKSKLKGFVLTGGGATSHIVILARGMIKPAVIKADIDLAEVQTGSKIVLNGITGEIILKPEESDIEEYQAKINEYKEKQQRLAELKDKPAVTQDSFKIQLAANMGTDEEIDTILDTNSNGIGLFRTEFLYMNNDSFPDEEFQFQVYKKVASKMKDRTVIIRTLDIGGDKDLPYLELPREMNPFLGLRAIRFCLERENIFLVQLKALLRAAKYGNIKIMFPLISTVEEFEQAEGMLERAKKELSRENIPYNANVDVGIMIEVPAAALTADVLAKKVDFFSIGTNDLIQYTMAVDRTNEKVSKLHRPYYPAVLRLINNTIKAAHNEGIWLGICGEAASDPLLAPIFVGMGIDELSMSAGSILEIKEIIRSLNQKKCREYVSDVLKLTRAEDVIEYLKKI